MSHAKRRMEQRFGIELTKDVIDQIVSKVKSRQAVLERQCVDNVARYKMMVGGKMVRVVYCHKTNRIITVMESKYLTMYDKYRDRKGKI